MFATTKNSNRSENLDYDAMMRQARAERARYLALHFHNWLAMVRQFVQRLLAGPRSTQRKMGIGLFLIITVLLIGWGLVPPASAQNEVILADCRFDAETGGLVGTSAALRSAISLANTRPGQDTIHLSPNCIYELDELSLATQADGRTNLTPITDDVVIDGFGAKLFRPDGLIFYRMLLVDGARVTIKDTTFENGFEFTLGRGGAIHLKNNAKLILENVSFIGNRTNQAGGAISTFPGDVTIRSSHFEGNQVVEDENTSQGGAISALGTIDIADSTFVNNSSRGSGGALSLAGSIKLEHNEFRANKAFNGSGGAARINFINSDAFVLRNKFFDNEASEAGGGLYVRDPRDNAPPTLGHVAVHNNLWVDQIAPTALHLYLHVVGNGPKSFTVHHNTFVNTLNQGNASGVHLVQAVSDLGALLPTKTFNNIVVGHAIGLENAGPFAIAGKRNLFFDNQASVMGNFPQVAPIFADPQFVNPANGDYHLKAGSDAIDTGTDTLPIILDLDGVNRQIHGPVPDIGAFEFVIKNPQDGPGDGTVFLPLVVK